MTVIPQMDPGAFYRAVKAETDEAVARVLSSGWYILGGEVAAFQHEFAAAMTVPHAFGVASGTDALVLALRALGIGPGDKVATVSHTAVATVAAIEIAGAVPVLVDIDLARYTMAPSSLEQSFAAFRDIKAVIAVHLYGQPAALPELRAIALRHDAVVIEDCAQAHGATLNGATVGSLGHAAAFSFYPTKNLGALGDGGMVATPEAEVAERLGMLREYGWRRRYISDIAGFNSRLDEMQAAILRVRLPRLNAENARRRAIAACYAEGLANTGLVLPREAVGSTHVFHQYVVRHPNRDAFQQRLRAAEIGTNIHYPVPVHLQPAYRGRVQLSPGGLAQTELAADQVLSLPMFPQLTDDQVNRVIDAVRTCF